MQETVQILLATYNGERFLREQLDSLFNQTFSHFTVLIRDDGSTDKSLRIIETYQQKYPSRIIVLKDNKKNVGAAQNFGILLEHSTADYIFFCDQDDIWLPEKVEISLEKMKSTEQENAAKPCLIFSDMKAMDEAGKITADSVWKQLYLHPEYFTLNRLLVQNIPHGCTMLINRAMRNLATPIPKDAILHDHWIALLAVTCGNFNFIQEPTLLLRDHAQSVTRKPASLTDKIKRFSTNFLSKKEYEYYIKIRVNQAKALQLRTSSFINEEQFDLLKKFLQLEKTSGMERKKIFIQNKFYRTTFWHTLKMILRS
jgi:glycosyltransferase involved in cell wall biosynthesis